MSTRGTITVQTLEMQFVAGSLADLVITQTDKYYSQVIKQNCILFPYVHVRRKPSLRFEDH